MNEFSKLLLFCRIDAFSWVLKRSRMLMVPKNALAQGFFFPVLKSQLSVKSQSDTHLLMAVPVGDREQLQLFFIALCCLPSAGPRYETRGLKP